MVKLILHGLLKLTLKMLNCFKDYERYTCIHISFHILDFYSLEEDKIHEGATLRFAYTIYCQNHACLLMLW